MRTRLASTANDTLPSGETVVTDDEGEGGTDAGMLVGAIFGVIAGAILVYFLGRRWLQRRKLQIQQKQMYKVRVGCACACAGDHVLGVRVCVCVCGCARVCVWSGGEW